MVHCVFWPKLTDATVARSLCDSWACCCNMRHATLILLLVSSPTKWAVLCELPLLCTVVCGLLYVSVLLYVCVRVCRSVHNSARSWQSCRSDSVNETMRSVNWKRNETTPGSVAYPTPRPQTILNLSTLQRIYASAANSMFYGCPSVRPSVVLPLTPTSRHTISLYLLEGFQWNVAQIFIMWARIAENVFTFRGQRSRS